MRRMIHPRLLLLLSCAPLLGCGLLYEYPKTNTEEAAAACADGVDNDLDGRADCFDSGCAKFCSETDAQACADEVDNDADGDVDCRDSSCFDFCREEDASACSDGRDNDLDGNADCSDAACAAFCLENSDKACADGKDNDVDGLTDCADDGCAEHCPETGQVACRDDADNDHDGKVDCQDTGCDGFCPEESAGDCDDGRDNDGDGLSDGADALCWPLRAPQAARCASALATELFEGFDSPTYESPFYGPRWAEIGMSKRVDTYGDLLPVIDGIYRSGQIRRDYWTRFTANTGRTGKLSSDLASMVSARTFSGRWRDTSLSALVFVPRSSQLWLVLAPEHLAPEGQEPLEGAESAQVGIVLDGSAPSPTMSLLVEGQSFSTELPLPQACGLVYCQGGWATLSLSVVDDRLELRIDTTGEAATVTAPLPSREAFENSRMVLRGGTVDGNVQAGIDDLNLAIGGGAPCNARVPQVPSSSCEAVERFSDYGYGVSLAPIDDGYCALVVAGDDAAQSVTAWTTSDGLAFEPADLKVELPDGATVESAALATGPQGLGLAVSYTDQGRRTVGLGSLEGCTGKVSLDDGPALPPDAEELSYVISEAGEYQLYFTRPPTDQTQRTLWRFAAGTPVALSKLEHAELVAELPAGVNHPATVQRVGAGDLAMTYPTLPTLGPPRIGLLVSGASGSAWQAVEPTPLFGGNSERGFDQQGVRAIALASSSSGGFLLYGGLESQVLTAGTALLELSGVEPPAAKILGVCGDGACDANESCSTCSADCECPGPNLVSDVLSAEAGWQYRGGTLPEWDMYFNESGNALNWSGSYNAEWLALPLDLPVAGDFELSFDFLLTPNNDIGPCDSVYVGIGAMPNGVADPTGVFARMTAYADCADDLMLSPLVRTPDEEFKEFGPLSVGQCRTSQLRAALSSKVRVLLRREGRTVTVLTADTNSCEHQTTVSYSGALPDPTTLLFGLTDSSANGSGQLTNLELRLLAPPKDCPAAQTACGDPKACVDTDSNQEHCGGCGQACEAGMACVAGECACDERTLECGNGCIDPQTDYDHCGSCDGVCDLFCFVGQCDVGETCDAPAVLPTGSSKWRFDPWFSAIDFPTVCDEPSFGDAVFSWTAEKSGTTIIEVQGVNGEVPLELAITQDLTCAEFDSCEYYSSGLGDGKRTTLNAKAGTEYRIVVALTDDPLDTVTELRITAP